MSTNKTNITGINQYLILRYVLHHPGAAGIDIVKRYDKGGGAIYPMLRSMEREGFLEKRATGEKTKYKRQQQYFLYLTAKGVDQYEEVERLRAAGSRKIPGPRQSKREEVIELAKKERSEEIWRIVFHSFSGQQQEILKLVAIRPESTYKEIAEGCSASTRTISSQIRKLKEMGLLTVSKSLNRMKKAAITDEELKVAIANLEAKK